jgi:ABC-2 type transport system ATP-binding protein
MLLGLVSPTSGQATIGGQRYRDLGDPVTSVGAVLEATSFHPARRARAHLRMIALAGGIDPGRVDAVLDLVGLSGDAKRRVGGFSLGMRQRLELAGAMLGDPSIVILDEPANGLDPQGIVWLREFMRHLASEGRTVLISSHLLAEVSQTVDEVVIISQGQLRAQGSLAELTAHMRPSMRVRTPEADRLVALLPTAGLAGRRVAHDVVIVDDAGPERLGPVLADHHVVIYELAMEGNSLETMFLTLTAGLGFGQPAMPAPPGYQEPWPGQPMPVPGYAPPAWAPPGYAVPPGYAPPGYAPPGWAPPDYAAPQGYPAGPPPAAPPPQPTQPEPAPAPAPAPEDPS